VEFRSGRFECPCHGAEFDGTTGDVLRGPARTPLVKITIKESDGTLYAS
jgi:Rieske Fe-S protein